MPLLFDWIENSNDANNCDRNKKSTKERLNFSLISFLNFVVVTIHIRMDKMWLQIQMKCKDAVDASQQLKKEHNSWLSIKGIHIKNNENWLFPEQNTKHNGLSSWK